MMIKSLVIIASSWSLFVLPCQASGPCSKDIAHMRSKIDAKLGSLAAAGSSVTASSEAKMHRQPTPKSMAEVLVERGVLSASTVEQIKGAMTRANAANAVGNKGACELALADAERALPP